jgi:hypothetical protein
LKKIDNRLLLVLARVLDHRIGVTDDDAPEMPILTVKEALVSMFVRFLIVLVNFLTCAAVIANIIHHW